MYLFLVPAKFDGTELMKRMWVDCVLPEGKRCYDAAVKEVQTGGFQELGVISESTKLSAMLERFRSVFTFDGCWQQLNAVMLGINPIFTELGSEGFKFAAASTMAEQPNDVGHVHAFLKNFFNNAAYKGQDLFAVPPYLTQFKSVLQNSGLESASFHTYWKALCMFEDAVSKVCTTRIVKEGFIKSGVYPYNANTILSGWSGYHSLPTNIATKILEIIPDLTEIAKRRGRVTDDEIESAMGHLIDFNKDSHKPQSFTMHVDQS